MKNRGCFFLFLAAVAGLIVVYELCKGLYWLLIPDRAAALSLFHMYTIAFHDYYTAVPSGTLSARILTITLFTLALWFLLGGMALGIEKLGSEKSSSRLSVGAFYFIVVLWIYSVGATLFVPKRLVVYDTADRVVKITDFKDLFLIWPNPFPRARQEVPFAEIRGFRYTLEKEHVMGASHDEAALYALTTTDTLYVGHTMLYHGEFGWITDWRSHEEIIESGRQEANAVAVLLDEVVGVGE